MQKAPREVPRSFKIYFSSEELSMNPVSHLGDELRYKHCHDYLDCSRSTVARTQLFLDFLNGQLALLQNHIIGALRVRKGLAQKLGIDADGRPTKATAQDMEVDDEAAALLTPRLE